ncbi:hypothetical protein P3X46_014630 [Hevea brasiliensis]|uniref:Uncharacterized protein n=2 Tax=Hevea brasiliensis TaxID=3981 RepID=A0A6A6MQ84_HEVBR|nr:root meristem growth factor 10-like [Hevea brasiliensis]KAF2315384.1 hypothetical protein GH714_039087 [Hevea brasiliensis]KAJ9171239.1 hypothetical protein P3X46_014630 [Hevea brasiliensis]
MSVVSCLLLLLLCLPLHARSARRLASADQNLLKKFHISNQNDEKKVSVAPMESSSSNERAKAAKEESIPETRSLMSEENAKHSGSTKKESLVSVPWRVPHNKHGAKKHPGFNLDYSPPKTHPPSHN